MNYRSIMMASLIAVAGASAASAVTISPFVIPSPPQPAGSFIAPSISGSVNGFNFTATGATVNDDLTPNGTADVGFFRSADSNLTGFGVNAFGSPFNIDGTGINRNELLRFAFTKPVRVLALAFTVARNPRINSNEPGFTNNDDVYVAVTGQPGRRFGNVGGAPPQNPPSTTNQPANPLVFNPFLEGRSFDIVAGFPNQECRANNPNADCGGDNDNFRLIGMSVVPVPLPAPILFALTAFGGLFIAARRRRAAAA